MPAITANNNSTLSHVQSVKGIIIIIIIIIIVIIIINSGLNAFYSPFT